MPKADWPWRRRRCPWPRERPPWPMSLKERLYEVRKRRANPDLPSQRWMWHSGSSYLCPYCPEYGPDDECSVAILDPCGYYPCEDWRFLRHVRTQVRARCRRRSRAQRRYERRKRDERRALFLRRYYFRAFVSLL